MCVPGGVSSEFVRQNTLAGPLGLIAKPPKERETPSPRARQAPQTTTPTTTDTTVSATTRAREEERRRLAARGRRGTILTSAAGLVEPASTRPKTLLGA